MKKPKITKKEKLWAYIANFAVEIEHSSVFPTTYYKDKWNTAWERLRKRIDKLNLFKEKEE